MRKGDCRGGAGITGSNNKPGAVCALSIKDGPVIERRRLSGESYAPEGTAIPCDVSLRLPIGDQLGHH